jgi:hypothetical protein
MKRDLSLRRPAPLDAVARHPAAAVVGGVVTALVFGVMGALGSGSGAAVVMTLAGLVVGAPGAAYIVASIDRE